MQKITMEDGQTANIIEENLAQMKALFPEAFTEGKVDFDVLRQLLGDASVLDEGEEKYGLNWHGKKQARQISLTPSSGTLLPQLDHSVDWETTRNVFIEGDNLETLKLLRKSYANSVKLIYIDPPYNTGKEFVYPDNYQDNLETYLRYTGQVNGDGLKLSSNSESSGRKHTKWLNMIYPRLMVAKSLLSKSGVIAISIDDNECHRLKIVCDEVFGEENFLADISIVTGANQSGDGVKIQKNVEHLIVYARDIDQVVIHRIDKVSETLRSLSDAPTPLETRKDMGYTIYYNPNTREFRPVFDYDREQIHTNDPRKVYKDDESLISDGFVPIRPGMRNKKLHRWRWGVEMLEERREELVFKRFSGEWTVSFKQAGLNPPKNIWNYSGGTTELSALFDGHRYFDYPKGISLLKYIVAIFSSDGDLILDFFAGSGSTAHAIFEQCIEDGASRRFLLVQLQEPFAEDADAFKAGFRTLSELAIERCKRAGEKAAMRAPKLDKGFRVFKLAQSNLRTWSPDRANLEATLLGQTNHLIEGRSEEDILFELLLKRGVDLSSPIEERQFAGKTTFSVGFGVLFACLASSIKKEEVDAIAQGIIDWHRELDPETDTHVFFRDSAFADDVAKTNMAAILEQNGI